MVKKEKEREKEDTHCLQENKKECSMFVVFAVLLPRNGVIEVVGCSTAESFCDSRRKLSFFFFSVVGASPTVPNASIRISVFSFCPFSPQQPLLALLLIASLDAEHYPALPN